MNYGHYLEYYHKLFVSRDSPGNAFSGEYRTPLGPGSEGVAYGECSNAAFAGISC